MGGKYALRTDAEKLAFKNSFILDGISWRECDSREDPFKNIELGLAPTHDEYPIFTSFFKVAGLKIPLDPLLVDFLINTNFHLCQLTPNVLRIILGTSELNRRFKFQLGLKEIKYCYLLIDSDDKWNLRARPHSPSIVEGLASSHKGMHDDVVLLTGTLEPDPANKRIPRYFSTPVGGAKKCFRKSFIDDLNLNHLNAAINHDGPDNRGPSNHPRSAHILLNYNIASYTTFSNRTNIVKWVGPILLDKLKYEFFRDHNIINPWVVYKTERIRQRLLAGESPDLEFPEYLAFKKKRGKGQRKGKRFAAGSSLVIEVVSHSPVDHPLLQSDNMKGFMLPSRALLFQSQEDVVRLYQFLTRIIISPTFKL